MNRLFDVSNESYVTTKSSRVIETVRKGEFEQALTNDPSTSHWLKEQFEKTADHIALMMGRYIKLKSANLINS